MMSLLYKLLLDAYERVGGNPKNLSDDLKYRILAAELGRKPLRDNSKRASLAALTLAALFGTNQAPAMAQTINVQAPSANGESQQGQNYKSFSISYNLRDSVLGDQKLKNGRVKAVKDWLYKVSINANYINDKINWRLVAEGFIPVFYSKDNSTLTALQFKGEYAKVESGEHSLEAAVGVVVNTALNNNKAIGQVGIFYQQLRDFNGSLDFGVISGVAAYKSGKFKLSLYASTPTRGRHKIGSQDSTKTTTSTETSGGSTITRTTQTDTNVSEYMEARKVVTFIVEYDASQHVKGLTLRLGGAIYSGIEGKATESGNQKVTVGGVDEEKRIILGLSYVSEWISRLFNAETTIDAEGRFGDGKPEYSIGIRVPLGGNNKGKNNGKNLEEIVDLRQFANLERIRVIRYSETTETTSRSPKVSSTCATEVIVDEDYSCTYTVSEGKISKIKLNKGPSFLSFSGNTLLGKPGVGDIGSHPIEVEIEGSLKTIVGHTLKVNDVETLSGTYAVTPTSGTTSLSTTHKIEISGGKAPYKIKIKYDDGTSEEITSTTSKSHSKSHTYSSGTFKSEVTLEDKLGRTKTLTGSTVEVASTLSGTYSVTPTSGVTPLTATHTVNISGGKGPYIIKYDFNNDGTIDLTVTTSSTSNIQSNTHTSSGTSRVTIEDILGNSKTLTNSIEVVATLSGSYSVTPTSGVTPLPTTHTISITGGKAPFTIKYDFNNDGTIDKTVTTSSTSDSQSNTYSSAGIVTPKATIEDKLGQTSTLTGSSVNAVAPLSASCSGSPTSAEAGQSVTYTANVSGGTGTNTFSWSGDASGTTQSVSTSYTISGTKTANVAVTSNGQSASASCSVNVPDKVGVFINDVTVTEGNSGTANATFTVNLSRTSNVATTISFTTQDGTATAGTDYSSTSGTLTIPAGSTSVTITINVIGDTDVESDETFKVKLSNPPTHATITDDEGIGTIQNDDVAPPPPPG